MSGNGLRIGTLWFYTFRARLFSPPPRLIAANVACDCVHFQRTLHTKKRKKNCSFSPLNLSVSPLFRHVCVRSFPRWKKQFYRMICIESQFPPLFSPRWLDNPNLPIVSRLKVERGCVSTNYATTVVVVHDGRNNVEYHIQACEPRSFHLFSPKCPHHDFVSQAPCPANRTREMISLYVAATLNLSRPNCYRVLRTVALAILSNQTLRQTLYLHFDHTSCRNLDPSRFEGNWIGMYNNNNWIVFPRRIFSSMCREKE